ncbi:DinB family protein [Alkalicoccus chagannorensis]|uniref:DinB family protein n=1 Tax=Alkalicoccus chagannorensis TaxID=427072 RepID=UPI000419969A|nr:DinB family protein [Alkalicoccus chagannorensis]
MKEYTLAPVTSRESLHLLGGLVQTREKLLDFIAGLDEEDIHHPVQEFPTIGGYALHLAQIEWWWNFVVLRDEGISSDVKERFRFSHKQEIPAAGGLEKSYILARLGESRMHTREFFYALSDQEFRRPDLTISGGSSDEFFSPEWVLHHLHYHESYHLGQMNMLRQWMNGQREKWEHFNTPYLSM